MAKRVTLTNQGLSLLASSSEATGQYYWLGYYAMAYVPNLWKNETVDLPVDECGKVNEGSLGSVNIRESDTDQVTPNMTRLTKYGDMIYNVWQGDLNGTGFLHCSSDGSAGGDLFGLTMYNTNIKKHYRYVLDNNGNNTLVGWVEDPSYSDGTMLGKHVFKGTDGYVSSTMPIPAPLYYLGDVTGKISVDSFFDDLPTFEQTSGPAGNGADLYPVITVQLKSTGFPELDVPRVSADYRGYTDSQGNVGTWNYGGTPATPYTSTGGTYFDTLEIPYPVDPSNGFDETSWFAADQTFNINGGTVTAGIFGEEFWKLHTISNYNRFHAPVDSIGHVLNSDLSNRNMAKTTKLFPISNYKVINTDSGYNANSEAVEVATAIKLNIDVDITPRTLVQGFDENCAFDDKNNIEFFEKYNNPLNPTDALDSFGNNIYNSTHTSFKFNRIGVYAVPLRKAPYVIQDNGFSTDPSGQNIELEFQINPDEEPILYAVVDWDNTIYMSDTGDGLNQFRAEFDVNLQSPDGVNDTALVRDATIFYNLYEDDALRWYQNQLIANASTQNAITEIGLEVASIKNKSGDSGCCPTPDLSGKYAPLDHTHDFLRNLKDSNNKLENGLKGIATAPEGSEIAGEVYNLGLEAVALGKGTSAAGDQSFAVGLDNYITSNSWQSSILNGQNNAIVDSARQSTIINGQGNSITGLSFRSLIGTSGFNRITDGVESAILVANGSLIEASVGNTIENSIIVAGSTNELEGQLRASVILAGTSNSIHDVNEAMIGSGENNYIYGNSVRSFIGSGGGNRIFNVSAYSSITSGSNNTINGSAYSFIGAGINNDILNSTAYAFIGTGDSNIIDHGSSYGSIISGRNNRVDGSAFSIVGAGEQNYIDLATHSSILSGLSNYINSATKSMIGSGENNQILGGGSAFSFIGSGKDGMIDDSTYSFIGAGLEIVINGASQYSAVVSGSGNNLTAATYGFIGAGITNNISDSTHTFIGSGFTNIIRGSSEVGSNGYASSIVSGANNILINAFSFIGAGADNFSIASYSSITSGQNNYLSVEGTFSHIGSGGDNSLASTYGAISSGKNNYIGSDSAFSFIGAGVNNYIGAISLYSEVEVSRIAGIGIGCEYSVISGGDSNAIHEEIKYATILGGRDAWATNHGEVAHSAGAIRNGSGDIEAYNKHNFLMLRGKTTNDKSSTILTLTGNSGDNIVMHRGEGFAGTLTVVGYMKNAEVNTSDGSNVDTIYHEIHSISGVFAKDVGTANDMPVTPLTYNEYESGNEPPQQNESFIELDNVTITGSGTLVTVVKTAHGLSTTDLVYVTGVDYPSFNGRFRITVLDVNTFTYTTNNNVEVSNPTGGTVYKVGPSSYTPIDHLPSIVDTVIDYRYTRKPTHSCFGSTSGSDEIGVFRGYPVITFGSNDQGTENELILTIDSSDLYNLEIIDQSTDVFWTATFDLTWIIVK